MKEKERRNEREVIYDHVFTACYWRSDIRTVEEIQYCTVRYGTIAHNIQYSTVLEQNGMEDLLL